jgi:hypothetical protein
MAFKTHTITKYAYSITMSSNDYAAKIQLFKEGNLLNNFVEVGNVKFIYEGSTVPAAEIASDLESATMYLPEKKMMQIIDLLRNEKPILLTINPPFAFLGTSIEKVGDGDKR